MSIASPFLAGIAQLIVNGTSYLLEGDLSYKVSTVARETLIGQDAVHGFAEKPVAGFISCNIRDSGGLSVASINAMTNVTVIAQLANGKTIIGTGMWSVDSQEVSTEDGKIPVKWESPTVVEA